MNEIVVEISMRICWNKNRSKQNPTFSKTEKDPFASYNTQNNPDRPLTRYYGMMNGDEYSFDEILIGK